MWSVCLVPLITICNLFVILCLFTPILSDSVPDFSKLVYLFENEMHSECSKQACIHEASQMLKSMDFSIDPCDDFYSFACGKFLNETVIPDDKEKVNIFSITKDKRNRRLHALLSVVIDPSDLKPFNIAKKFYKTCMKESLIEEQELPIKKSLQDILDTFGGWPVVKGDEWDVNSEWDWVTAIEEFNKIGYRIDHIIDFKIITDPRNASSRIYVKYE